MSHHDRADRLERLIAGERASLDSVGEGPLSAPGVGAEAPDAELRELASLATMLTELGREAPVLNADVGWARLKPLILSTPQRHRRRWSPSWPTLGWGWFGAPAVVLRIGAAAFVLCLVLVGSALLALPRQSASAAFANDMQQLNQTTAVAAGRGALSADDRVTVERQAQVVLSRAAAADSLAGLRREQAQIILGQLNEAQTRLVLLLGDDTSADASVLATLNAVSGLLQSALGASAADTSIPAPMATAAATATSTPTAAAILPPPTLLPRPTLAPTLAPSPVRPDQPVPNAAPRTPGDNSGRAGAPAPEPSLAALLASVQPACSRVFDGSSLATCAEAVAAASAWCGLLPGDSAQNCERAVGAPLIAAQQRVQRLSAGCQRLPTTRTQQACTDVTERGNAADGRARAHDQSPPDHNRGN